MNPRCGWRMSQESLRLQRARRELKLSTWGSRHPASPLTMNQRPCRLRARAIARHGSDLFRIACSVFANLCRTSAQAGHAAPNRPRKAKRRKRTSKKSRKRLRRPDGASACVRQVAAPGGRARGVPRAEGAGREAMAPEGPEAEGVEE